MIIELKYYNCSHWFYGVCMKLTKITFIKNLYILHMIGLDYRIQKTFKRKNGLKKKNTK